MYEPDREMLTYSRHSMRQLEEHYKETNKELEALKESMAIPEKKPGLPTKLAKKYQGNFFLTYLFVGGGIWLTEVAVWGLFNVTFDWGKSIWGLLGPLCYVMLTWWIVTSFFVGLLVHKHKGFEDW